MTKSKVAIWGLVAVVLNYCGLQQEIWLFILCLFYLILSLE